MFRKNRGFTLIELLVVISIIGLLSSIALASVNSARAKAINRAIKTNMETVRKQAYLYFEDHNQTYGTEQIFPSDPCSKVIDDGYILDQTVFADPLIQQAITRSLEISGVGGGLTSHCYTLSPLNTGSGSLTHWIVTVPIVDKDEINGNYFWCIDSLGNATRVPQGYAGTFASFCAGEPIEE